MKVKFKIVFLTTLLIMLSLCGNAYASTQYFTGEKSDHARKETYLHGITAEMCAANYWKDKTFYGLDKIIMNNSQIDTLNRRIVDGSGTMVFDLEELNKTFDADSRKQSLANSEIPTRDLYVNGAKINNEEYFTSLLTAIAETGYTGTQQTKLGVCTNRADMKAWPTNDVIGYSASDTDDEMQSSALNLNEPMIIQAKCEVNGDIFYWGYSNNCTGWVSGKNVAVCQTESEWLDYWKISSSADDFVTVTGSRIVLNNGTSETVNAMMGTYLKLVPEELIPLDLASKKADNYIVYFAGNDENGNAVKQYAVLNKSLELHRGFLPLTEENVLEVAFSCIGDPYGWAGMNGYMDCSLYTRSIYKCFGVELPRNTTWQEKTPDKYKNISDMSDEQKIQYISTLPAGSLLYFPGHTMVYLGIDGNKNFVVSDLGSVVDEVGDLTVRYVNAVTVNSLDVRRGAAYGGTTWLHNITGVISFAAPIDINDCSVEIESNEFEYDGLEKKPKVMVKYNDKPVYEGVNYTVEYSNNIETGEASVCVEGINNFTGKSIKTFEIKEIPKNKDDNEIFENTEKEESNNQTDSKQEMPTESNGKNYSPTNLKSPYTGADNYDYILTPCFLISITALFSSAGFYAVKSRKRKND